MTDGPQSRGDSGRPVPVSSRVVDAVAAATDADPAELEPLYHSLDPDSLNALFEAGGPAGGATGCRVTFRYAGHQISVSGDGAVTVDVDGVTQAGGGSHPGGEPEAPD